MYNSDMPSRAELPSKRKLVRSTIIAAAAAAVLLVTVILPAEYGVDPTRVGSVLGLTEMGQIKQQLSIEAAKERASLPEAAAPAAPDVTDVIAPAPESAETAPPENSVSDWRDETSVTLQPGASAEIKLAMTKGQIARYEWVTDQGHLNSDLHADGANEAFISYRKGRAETSDSGEFTADFDGVHGWYWRNRSDAVVNVTLRVRGEYSEVKRVL